MTLEPRRGATYQGTSLIDVLDRILDKGLVVAGDVRISLANVELLTIRIRLLVCSIDKAEQIGLNWWRFDRFLVQPEGRSELDSEPESDKATIDRLEQRIAQLERQLGSREPSAPEER